MDVEVDVTTGGDLEQLEERFLAAIEQQPIPMPSLLGVLRFLHASGQGPVAESWAQTLKDVLLDSEDVAGVARLLTSWAAWRGNDRGFGNFCRDTLKKATKERMWLAMVDSVAFGEVPAVESLRRLELLQALKPGVACVDKTWGFGLVRRLDDFYKRVVVDFSGKPGHTLTMAYAAEVLSLVDEQHLLARQHRDPAGLARLVKEDAAEVVRVTLRSFGPMPAARLETTLMDHRVVTAADWKRFWDAARKTLKSDPLVDVPAKRTESITIRTEAARYDAAWFEAFRGERDTGEILRAVLALEAANQAASLDEQARNALSDRLAFAIKGAHNTDAALYVRLALAVRRLGLATPQLADLRTHLWEENRFVTAAETLPARDSGQMIEMLLADADAPARLLAAIPSMSFNLVSETLERLRQGESAQAAQIRCRELLAAASVPPTLLVWVLRNRDLVAGWPLPTLYEQMAHAIAIIEDDKLCGEMLRMQNHLRALFENNKWFEAAFRELSEVQRQAIFDRIQGTAGLWDPATQRTLIGRMIKLEPILADRKRSTAMPEDKPVVRWTSWRSLLERQAQFKQLLEVDIPRNSQDIATARSYGDLRENFEYHAAKHQQGLLLQRRDEWDRDLKQMHGTDFANAGTLQIGMGVRVTLRHADGTERSYSILGEWDRDEALNIISNRSRLAQVLEGKHTGDTVIIPGADGDVPVTVTAIEPLDAAVHAWVGAKL